MYVQEFFVAHEASHLPSHKISIQRNSLRLSSTGSFVIKSSLQKIHSNRQRANQHASPWELVQSTVKKSSRFKKKIIHIDDIMIPISIKYFFQTRLCLWDIKITNFKLAWNLLFLYLTNEVEFEQNILQFCVLSYHLHVWFVWWIYIIFLSWFARVFTKTWVCNLYVPILNF
jgi:hypothetical protein